MGFSNPKFRGHGVTINALDVLCAQLTRDRASFLFISLWFLQMLTEFYSMWHFVYRVNLQHNNY